MKSITTQLSYLGNHISYTLSSVPRPHIGTQQIKDALRSGHSRLSRVAGRVVRACRPDENVGPPAQTVVAASKKSVTFGLENTARRFDPGAPPNTWIPRADADTRRARFAQSRQTTAAQPSNSRYISSLSSSQSSETSESSSEEDRITVTEHRLDFRGIAEFTSEFTTDEIDGIQNVMNQRLDTVNRFASLAMNGKRGTPMWTHSVQTVISTIDELSKVMGDLRSTYMKTGGNNEDFSRWLDTKLTDLRSEKASWQTNPPSAS